MNTFTMEDTPNLAPVLERPDAIMFNTITITFFAFLLMFIAVGLYSVSRKKSTPEDYLLAGRGMSPWLVALSAVATQNSGFMFIGLTGTAFSLGIKDAVWLEIGWVLGDLIAWRVVHPGVRTESGKRGVRTIPEFLGGGMKHGRVIVVVSAVITLVFLGLYASAQFTAGRKALDNFDIDAWLGVLLGASVVIAYCFSGGIRASIWTDAVQSVVMLVSIFLLVGVAIMEVGGLGGMWDKLEAIDPALVSWNGGLDSHMLLLFILGWMAGGFGVVGQPHIMIRVMTLDSPANMRKAQYIYILWFSLFALACVMVGLLARLILPFGEGFDPEHAFPMLSAGLLPGALVGLMLAGVFAATISTADSQILSCSAAITQDLSPKWSDSYLAVKLGTLAVTAVATTIALLALQYPDTFAGVFSLVIFAWSGLASSLGPLVVVRALARPITMPVALVMIVAGLVTVVLWNEVLAYDGYTYAALPGMLVGSIVYLIASVTVLEQKRPETA